MGFGHRVYKDGDPRARILKDHCRRLAATKEQQEMEETAEGSMCKPEGGVDL